MKKRKTIIAAIVLLLVFVVGGAIAYFTDTDDATNKFTIGSVDIDLVEEQWDALTKTEGDANIPDVAENMMPGESVAKDPVVKNLSTKNDAYVFLKVEVPCSKTYTTTGTPSTTYDPVELFTYAATKSTAWTELSSAAVACTDSGTATHVYYYSENGNLKALTKASNASTPTATPALFTQVTLVDTLISQQIPSPDTAKDIKVTAYGIQTEGLASTAPADVWDNFS